MKKINLFVLLLCILQFSWAQYNRPYRIAYNSVSKAYLITNRGNGTVVQLDSNYKTSTVITGLTDPRDLIIGTFAGTSGLLIVDNNEIVVFDAASFQRLIAYKVSVASELEDIEIDPDNPGFFYLSDVGNSSIIKGQVGPPPFYTPSFKVLSQGKIHRPRGMLYDGKGKLMVVTDTVNGQVIQIDTANGSSKVLFTPGLDSLNHLAKDKEGNIYMTNWKDSYLYRTNAAFDTLVKLTSYNKPAGMYVNVESDLMLLACFLCDKLEFHRLHYASPKAEMHSCFRDSVIVDLDIQTNGIGTYVAGNKFLIELSDSTGDFTKPLVLGSILDIIKPSLISAYLPNGTYASKHQYRIRTTHPPFSSPTFDWFVYATPVIDEYLNDSVFVCSGSSAILGKKSNSKFEFRWSTGVYLDDSLKAMAEFTGNDRGTFEYGLFVKNAVYGCADSGKVVVQVNPNLRLNPWTRERETCVGDSIGIGGNQLEYQYRWSPITQLDDGTKANPIFDATVSRKYHLQVLDTVSGCTGTDSVYVVVHELPKILAISTDNEVCANDTLNLDLSLSWNAVISWTPGIYLSDSTGNSIKFSSDIPGDYSYSVEVVDSNGCSSDTSKKISNHSLPTYTGFEILDRTTGFPANIRFTITTDSSNIVELFWDSLTTDFVSLGFMNKSRDTVMQIDTHLITNNFFAVVTNRPGCKTVTDTTGVLFVGVKDLNSQHITAYPNPVKDILHIYSPKRGIQRIQLMNTLGVVDKSQYIGNTF